MLTETSKIQYRIVIPQVLDENQSLFLNLSQYGLQIASDIWLIIGFLMKPIINSWLNKNQTRDWLKSMQTNYRASLGAPGTVFKASKISVKIWVKVLRYEKKCRLVFCMVLNSLKCILNLAVANYY